MLPKATTSQQTKYMYNLTWLFNNYYSFFSIIYYIKAENYHNIETQLIQVTFFFLTLLSSFDNFNENYTASAFPRKINKSLPV